MVAVDAILQTHTSYSEEAIEDFSVADPSTGVLATRIWSLTDYGPRRRTLQWDTISLGAATIISNHYRAHQDGTPFEFHTPNLQGDVVARLVIYTGPPVGHQIPHTNRYTVTVTLEDF